MIHKETIQLLVLLRDDVQFNFFKVVFDFQNSQIVFVIVFLAFVVVVVEFENIFLQQFQLDVLVVQEFGRSGHEQFIVVYGVFVVVFNRMFVMDVEMNVFGEIVQVVGVDEFDLKRYLEVHTNVVLG